MRDVFLWAAKRLKKFPHHRNPPLHGENGLIGAFKGRTRDLNLFVANRDLRSAGRVHHMDYPGIHVRFGGQSVGQQSHGDSHISTIGRGITGYERRPAPVGELGAQKRGKRQQVSRSRIHARENLTTAGDADHTHLPPASALRQPTRPSSGLGQRTAMDNGSSSHGPAFVRGRPPRPKHWDPEVVFTNSKAAGGAGVTRRRVRRGGALPLGALERPPRRAELGKFPTMRQPNVTRRRISANRTLMGLTRW